MVGPMTTIIAIVVTLVIFFGYLSVILRRKHGKTKTVSATIVNKQIAENFSKYSGTSAQQLYYVTFLIDGKRKSFTVSEFSYSGYRIGERGTLKYKGNQLIDFH